MSDNREPWAVELERLLVKAGVFEVQIIRGPAGGRVRLLGIHPGILAMPDPGGFFRTPNTSFVQIIYTDSTGLAAALSSMLADSSKENT